MIELWERLKDTTPFFSKLHKVVQFYKFFCITKVEENKMMEKEMWKRLEVTYEMLQNDPQDYVAQKRFG
jgi:hypothetical protein